MKKALEMFASKGYHSSTTAEIAKAAGIAKGTLFNYFESKEHLLKSLVFDTLIELANMIDPNEDGTVSRIEFFETIERSRKWISHNSQFLSLYFSMVAQPAVFEIFKTEIWEKMIPYLERLTKFFEREGFPEAYAESRFFLAMLDGIGIHYAMDPENFPLQSVCQKVAVYYQQKMQ